MSEANNFHQDLGIPHQVQPICIKANRGPIHWLKSLTRLKRVTKSSNSGESNPALTCTRSNSFISHD